MSISLELIFLVLILFLIIDNWFCLIKSDSDIFEEILNNPKVNSKAVGQSEDIKYFQFQKNGKTGFRDLDGNIVLEPIYDSAELFSEGFSAVQIDRKWGLIDKTGKYRIKPKFEFLGGVHEGLAAYRDSGKYGFVVIQGNEKIKPRFDWVGEFSEGLCAVRKDNGKYSFIDVTGEVAFDTEYQYACNFESGFAKVQINDFWCRVDKLGKIVFESIREESGEKLD